MASRRTLMRAAVVAAIGELGLAGGVQPLTRPSNNFTTLPTVIVSQLSEDKGTPAPTSKIGNQLELAVDVFPEQVAGDVSASIDDLVVLVEQKLLGLNLLDPPLGVPGATELVLGGHEVFALDEEGLVGAAMQVFVRYRHDIDDPETFEGTP